MSKFDKIKGTIIKLHIEDKVFDKVMYFLKNLPKNEVENITVEDWSHLEFEIEKGLNSGVNHMKI
uniref:hypothetical protein n=1 Tax=Aliarcobacter sp. TaxID=2321116 RepID=UPI0040473543